MTGLLLGTIITRYYFNNFILEVAFLEKVGMVSVDKRILNLLHNKKHERAITLFEKKVNLEILGLETEWLIRGDSMHRSILYPTFIDTNKAIGN